MNNYDAWRQIYNGVMAAAQYRHTTHIAGGCIRDYMLGLPHNDIDVFLDAAIDRVSSDDFVTRMEGRGFTYRRRVGAEEYPGADAGFNVAEFHHPATDNIVQVMGLRNTFLGTHYRHFDNNMVRCYYSEQGVHLSRGFMEGMENKKVTPWAVSDEGDASIIRANNFIDKANTIEPGWVRDPFTDAEWNALDRDEVIRNVRVGNG